MKFTLLTVAALFASADAFGVAVSKLKQPWGQQGTSRFSRPAGSNLRR
jgi:hypothetical protein